MYAWMQLQAADTDQAFLRLLYEPMLKEADEADAEKLLERLLRQAQAEVEAWRRKMEAEGALEE